MNSFIKELRDLIKNHIGITINNESSNSKDQRKRKRSITSSDISSDEIDDYNNVNMKIKINTKIKHTLMKMTKH